ncbi:MAG: hypothetical protein HIU83_12345 [Proteobacteria bacterium]|nr:hypothetical protein [Pseudomonadota bacterium]
MAKADVLQTDAVAPKPKRKYTRKQQIDAPPPSMLEVIASQKGSNNVIIRPTVPSLHDTILDRLKTGQSKADVLMQAMSDILCQVCTGGGISYRQLYTDEGENIAQIRHVVIINSIRLAIVNADLMDRSIIIKLKRIAPEDRKPEHDLWEDFDRALPIILGGIFDTIVKAMAIYLLEKSVVGLHNVVAAYESRIRILVEKLQYSNDQASKKAMQYVQSLLIRHESLKSFTLPTPEFLQEVEEFNQSASGTNPITKIQSDKGAGEWAGYNCNIGSGCLHGCL